MVDRYGSPAYMGDMSIQIAMFRQLEHRDIAPLADGLNEHVLDVRTRRYNIGPPAADSDIIIMVILLVSGQAAAGFFGELGKDIYYGLREQLLFLYHRARQGSYPGPTIPITIKIGRVRFNFEGELSREELLEHINRAHEYIERLPSSYLEGSSQEPDYNLFWNEELESWEESSREGVGASDTRQDV